MILGSLSWQSNISPHYIVGMVEPQNLPIRWEWLDQMTSIQHLSVSRCLRGFLPSVARMVFVSPSCENLDPTDEELVDEIEEGDGLDG